MKAYKLTCAGCGVLIDPDAEVCLQEAFTDSDTGKIPKKFEQIINKCNKMNAGDKVNIGVYEDEANNAPYEIECIEISGSDYNALPEFEGF